MGAVPPPGGPDDRLEIGEPRRPAQPGLRLVRAPRTAPPDRPDDVGATVQGTVSPVTRSTVSITSRTECGRPVPRL